MLCAPVFSYLVVPTAPFLFSQSVSFQLVYSRLLVIKVKGVIFSGGAQIIDMMVLVVDVTKGMQTQTAECLVIGEILCNKMIVVLNKIDLLNLAKRNSAIEKVCLCYQVNIL